MGEISSKTIIDSTAKDLWNILGDFGGVSKYNPIVTKVITKGTGVGSQRTCTIQSPNQNSFEIDEILENHDDAKMSQVIKIVQAPPPFAGMVVTVQVSQLEQNQSKVEWIVNFLSGDMPESDAKKMLEGLFEQIGESLKNYFKN